MTAATHKASRRRIEGEKPFPQRCKEFGCPHAPDDPAYCCAYGGHWECKAGERCKEHKPNE